MSKRLSERERERERERGCERVSVRESVCVCLRVCDTERELTRQKFRTVGSKELKLTFQGLEAPKVWSNES